MLDFARSSASKESAVNTEAMDSDEGACSTPQDMAPDEIPDKESGPTSAAILTAIKDMKTEFSTKVDRYPVRYRKY